MNKLSKVAICVAVMLGATAPACQAAGGQAPAAAAPPRAAEPVNFPPASIPTRKSASPQVSAAGSIAIALRPGNPAFVGVRGRAGGYLYCYAVDDQDRISQLLAASDEPLVHAAAGEVSVFAARHAAGLRSVACFSSARLLGRNPLDHDGIQGGVEGLRTRFASASGNKFEMGVFRARYQ
jgi:hypothetical protein